MKPLAEKPKRFAWGRAWKVVEAIATVLFLLDYFTGRVIPDYVMSILGKGIGGLVAEGIFAFVVVGIVLVAASSAILRLAKKMKAETFKPLMGQARESPSTASQKRFSFTTFDFWMRSVVMVFVGSVCLFGAYVFILIAQLAPSPLIWGSVFVLGVLAAALSGSGVIRIIIGIGHPEWIPRWPSRQKEKPVSATSMPPAEPAEAKSEPTKEVQGESKLAVVPSGSQGVEVVRVEPPKAPAYLYLCANCGNKFYPSDVPYYGSLLSGVGTILGMMTMKAPYVSCPRCGMTASLKEV
jgi:DNA-directed RNA polymerase subunit RPC12/RpoP